MTGVLLLNAVRYQRLNDQIDGLNRLKEILPREKNRVLYPPEAEQTEK